MLEALNEMWPAIPFTANPTGGRVLIALLEITSVDARLPSTLGLAVTLTVAVAAGASDTGMDPALTTNSDASFPLTTIDEMDNAACPAFVIVIDCSGPTAFTS